MPKTKLDPMEFIEEEIPTAKEKKSAKKKLDKLVDDEMKKKPKKVEEVEEDYEKDEAMTAIDILVGLDRQTFKGVIKASKQMRRANKIIERLGYYGQE